MGAVVASGASGGSLDQTLTSFSDTTAPPDYDHYVTQQLKPIADAVLRFVGGPDFDELTGARHIAPALPTRRGKSRAESPSGNPWLEHRINHAFREHRRVPVRHGVVRTPS